MTTISTLLLPWYEQHGRHDLPWQRNKTAYRVWVSEIMLQQTQVKTVIPYYQRFLARFPNLKSLATAPIDDVLQHWAGLGYYTRARNLHKTAQILWHENAGRFPRSKERLSSLPGIGESTAAAIVSFAYSESATILDGNVKRVLTRFYAIPGDPNKTELKTKLWEIASDNTPKYNCPAYNQAIMDLGATCCTRTKPSCERCPLKSACRAYELGTPTVFPHKSAPIKRQHEGLHFVVLKHKNRIALVKRPSTGVWGGLWCFPDCKKSEELSNWLQQNGVNVKKKTPLERITHELSHRSLTIDSTLVECQSTNLFEWVSMSDIHGYGVPKPVSKILKGVLDEHESIL
jgi:A/G-specific adenine glycosylase